MWTRRSGEACDTAQNSAFAWQPVPPVTLIVRFDTERQKLTSAVQLPPEHWLTETFGPNADTFASGQIDGDPVAAAAAAGEIAAANPAPVTSAAAARTERHRRAAGRPRVILFISAAFAPQPW